MNAAMLQIHKELEEAAQISGAAQWRTSLRIVYPLVLPSIVGVLIWAMLQSIRQVGYPLLLTEGSNNEVLSVFVWRLWNEGQIGTAGAVGSIMIAGLLLITSALRVIGFRRAADSGPPG
jgi:iron(III) transport system permease protein